MKLSILIIFYTVSILILSGCGASSTSATPNSNSEGVTSAKEDILDPTLPKIELTKNGVKTSMKTIAFEYKNILDARVSGVYVFRSSSDEKSSNHYDTIENRFATHYIDKNVKPGHNYTYYFKTFSDTHESILSDGISVSSLPVLDSVSWIHSVEGMPRTAKIIWRPHTNKKVIRYIIERKTLEKDEWEVLAKVDGRLSAEYINEDLKDNYIYTYRVRVETYDDIISAPSQELKVITKPLPKSITNLIVTTDLPKVIELNWDKADAKDLGLYHLYRADTADGKLDLIATLHNNHFIDNINENGKQYFYKVSVVDKDLLESIHQKIARQGSTLPIPKTPAITKAKIVNSQIELAWKNMDSRATSYLVKKKYKKGWLDAFQDDFEGITNNSFIDTSIESKVVYHYQVISVDKHGLQSEPSLEVEIKVPVIQKQVTEVKTGLKIEEVPPKPMPNKDVIIPIENLDLSEI
ncbi:MAG: hypothetical protein U9N02_09150 [Campylobacterota bacterium]|nr:hypothetical protein [Campylobacterota bacterium]